MKKVKFDVIKPWITSKCACSKLRYSQPEDSALIYGFASAERVTELLGFEDEVVIEYVFGQLEEARVRLPVLEVTSCPPTRACQGRLLWI